MEYETGKNKTEIPYMTVAQFCRAKNRPRMNLELVNKFTFHSMFSSLAQSTPWMLRTAVFDLLLLKGTTSFNLH